MKTVYLYVLDTMADWEPGLAIAELNTQRYFKEPKDWRVQTCALVRKPVVTAGGVTITPDHSIDEIDTDSAALLILPGADIWLNSAQEQAVSKIQDFLHSNVPVAAICGATTALAQAHMLDKVKHTSNGLEYLQMLCPNYKGAENYRDELAVTDGNIITAGSSAPVEFAYHILKRLAVFEPAHLEYWYGYFGKHSIKDFLKLYEATQKKQEQEHGSSSISSRN